MKLTAVRQHRPALTLLVLCLCRAALAGEAVDELPTLEQVDPQLVRYIESERTTTLVVTASKKEQTIEEAPAIIEVISNKEMAQRGYRSVGEALRSIAGLAVIDDHVNWNIGVRGLYSGAGSASSILKVMINGQQTALRSTLGNAFGPELIPLSAIDRIEIIRGPGSALYGANAFLGVINIITLRGRDMAQDAAQNRVGVEGYYRESISNLANGGVTASSAGSARDFEYLIAGTYSYADRSGLYVPGLPDIVQGNLHNSSPSVYPSPNRYPSPGFNIDSRQVLVDTPVSQNDLERVGSAYADLGYNFETGRLDLDGNMQFADKGGEWQEYTYLTHNTRVTHINGFARAKYVLAPRNAPLSLTATAAYSAGGPTAQDQYEDPQAVSIIKKRRFGYNALDGALEGAWQFNEDYSLSVGIDYTHDLENLLRISTTNPGTNVTTYTINNGVKSFDNWGAYALFQAHVWQPLRLTVGARFDRNSQIACDTMAGICLGTRPNATAPPTEPGRLPYTVTNRGQGELSTHASAVVSFNAWLYSKLVYGSSFRPPSPFDLYKPAMTIDFSTPGNSFLKPQVANTIEVQVGTRSIHGFSGSIDIFGTYVNDLVVTLVQTDGAVLDRNADVQLLGLEAQAAWTLNPTWSVYGNLSYLISSSVSPQRNPDETAGVWAQSADNTSVPVGAYPTFLANAGVNAAFADEHVNVNLSLNYIGRRNASLTDTAFYSPLNLSKTYTLEPYLLGGVTVSTLGLHLINELETRILVQAADVSGGYFEAGYGGVDIPSLGARLLCRIEQYF